MKINKDDVVRLLESGLTAQEVARELNVANQSIYRYIHANGLERYLPKTPRKNKQGKWDKYVGKISYLHDEGVRNLVAAIITTAVADYEKHSYGLEHFFTSEWYELLCSALDNPVDGSRIIEEVRKRKENR